MTIAIQEPAFCPLPLGAIMPAGWLARQLRIQADGLSGHLCDFWPDVKDSQWFGGRAEGWERAPYWLDGAIPLAVLAGDEALRAKIDGYVKYILRHQMEDGYMGPGGPAGAERNKIDLWGLMLAAKALAQYADIAGRDAILPAIHKCLLLIDRHISREPLFRWAMYRSYETLIPLMWVYEHTHDERLPDLAMRLVCQGFDWERFYHDLPQAERIRATGWKFHSHVVNTAMAVKYGGLMWRLTGDEKFRRLPGQMLETLDRYHGQANGMFTGDECLAGMDPSQGTELCAVVEMMYSLEILMATLGEPQFADRLEQVTFNALPATFSPDMWTHQYDQQANQISCTVREKPLWTCNGPDANLFGLEPNYGCCTANLSQGWPKFAAHLWMATPEGGLAAVSYAPCIVTHKAGQASVELRVETEYPFRSDVHLTLRVDRPAAFPLLLRIPAWANGATVRVNGAEQPAAPGTFCRIERTWEGTTQIDFRLPMRAAGERRFNNSLSIRRGPLVYALPIGEQWTRCNTDLPNREEPHCDYEVRATTPWNYALDADVATLDRNLEFAEHPVGDCPFSSAGAPVSARVKGRRLAQWKDNGGDAVPLPTSPVQSDQPEETLRLIPYGCTNLRIAEFPTLQFNR